MLLIRVLEPLDVTVRYHALCGDDNPYSVCPAGEARVPPPEGAVTLTIGSSSSEDGGLRSICLVNSFLLLEAMLDDQRRREPPPDGRPRVVRLTLDAQRRVLRHPSLPVRLGNMERREIPERLEDQVRRIPRGPLRVGVVNSLDDRFGDAIMSLTLLRELRSRLAARFDPLEIELVQHRGNPETERLYLRSGLVQRIRLLPMPLTDFQGYGAYLDFTALPLRDDRHWVDDALEWIGVDPRSLPASRKRSWLPPESGAPARLDGPLARVREDGGPILLFHPRASAHTRTLAVDEAAALAQALLDRTPYRVACAIPLGLRHPRFLDWTPLSRSFDDFAYLISQADAFVSVDTCVYHVADAAGVPGVVLFATEPPEHRIAYYPYVEGLRVPGDETPDAGEVVAALERAVLRRAGDAAPQHAPPRRAVQPLPRTSVAGAAATPQG